MARITTSLQNTVADHAHIKNVYIDVKGNHYFQAFKLPATKEKDGDEKSYSLFGRGKHAGTRLIAGPNVDNKKEPIVIGLPGTEIVETLSRKEVLDAQATPDDHSAVAAILADPNAKAEFTKQLLQDPEFLTMLKAATAPAEGEPAKTVKAAK